MVSDRWLKEITNTLRVLRPCTFVPYMRVHKCAFPLRVAGMRKVQDLPVLLAAATAIKARRTEINISQEELAHRADVHRSFVARLELAETQPSLAVFFRLANALEVEVVELTRTIVRRAEQERRSAKKRSAT